MARALLLETFLNAVRGIRSTSGGTKETSFYTALNNLLDGAGHTLKPKVRCVMQLKNLGAGNPDGGLFTAPISLTAKPVRPKTWASHHAA